MLKKLVPLTLAAALGFGSAAVALTDTGTIADVNAIADTVTLTDGSTYVFDDADYADRLHAFKPGDRVAISWHHVGTRLEADAISPVTTAVSIEQDLSGHDNTHLD